MASITIFDDESGRRIARQVFRQEREALRNTLFSTLRQHSTPESPRGVFFRNTSNEEIPAYAVMRVTGGEDYFGINCLKVEKPSSSFQRLYLVNGRNKVAANSSSTKTYGYGTWLHDADWVLYDTTDGTPAYEQVWGPVSSSWKLRRHYYGFHILGGTNTSKSGSERVIAKQQMVMNVIGKTDASISKGSSGTVSVWKGDRSADTTINISSVATPFAAISSGKWVRVVWDAETPGATAAEC